MYSVRRKEMCKFSHFSKINREKTSKFLTLAFVISILIHGLTQIATSVWILVTSYSACAFLQKYYAPVYTHVTSGIGAVLVALFSIIGTHCYHNSCHVRYFLLGMGIIISLELSSILSAVVLDNMTKTHFLVAMEDSLTASMNDKNDSTSTEHVTCWTGLQEQYKCCGVTDYTDWCTDTKNTTNCEHKNDLFQSCKCPSGENNKQNKCAILDTGTIYGSSCLNSVSDKFATIFRLIIATDAPFCALQCVSYIVVNCILSRLNSKCVVDVYKIKPTENETKL